MPKRKTSLNFRNYYCYRDLLYPGAGTEHGRFFAKPGISNRSLSQGTLFVNRTIVKQGFKITPVKCY